MSISRPRMAWKLAVHSAHICQSLGFNRRDTLGTESAVATRRKKRLFLLVCVMEKSLAFRLGKASAIRNSEVPIVDTWMSDGFNTSMSPLWRKWIATCLLQDEVYDDLCSPQAQLQSTGARAVKARALAAEMEKLLFTKDAAEVSPYPVIHVYYHADWLICRSDVSKRFETPLGEPWQKYFPDRRRYQVWPC